MSAKIILASLLLVGALFLSATHAAPTLTLKDVAHGIVVAGSTSPDGKLCLIEGHVGLTTANAIVLASVDRQRVLADTALATLHATDRPHQGRITVAWSADGTRVALHDTITKHSAVALLRSAGDGFEPALVPDLLQAACLRWKIERAALASSGQIPSCWVSGDVLEVQVSARLKSGQPRALTLRLHVPRDGALAIETE